MSLAYERCVFDDTERRVKEKMDNGMSEEEARATTIPMNVEDVEQEDAFLKAREVKGGGYGGHQPTIDLANKVVSPPYQTRMNLINKVYVNEMFVQQ